MSWLVSGQISVVSLLAKAAQISSRWAWDFEGIAEMVPDNLPG
jgi:hypothetical protein